MTREDIEIKAKEFRKELKDDLLQNTSLPLIEIEIRCDYVEEYAIKMAEWVKNNMIIQASTWLDRGGYFINSNETMSDFIKSMKE